MLAQWAESVPAAHRASWPAALVAVVAGLVTFALRMLALTGFPNDEFVPLTRGAQVLLGEWPVRDFVEPGAPLMTLAAAAAQGIGGHSLLSEAVLTALGYAAAAALTVLVVDRLAGSLLMAVWAVATEVMSFPRPYSYPKFFLYAAAAGAVVAYASRPTRGRLFALALLVAVAFLFRHDHGIYIGAAAAAGVVTRRAWDDGRAGRACAVFVALVLFLLLPYLAYVEATVGLREYVSVAMEFSRVEALRSRMGWPNPGASAFGSSEGWAAILFYLCWMLALSGAAFWFVQRRMLPPMPRAAGAALVVLAVAVNAGFLRDALSARIADVMLVAVLLVTWIAAQGQHLVRRSARRATLALIGATMAVMSVGAAQVGAFREQLDRAGVNAGVRGVSLRAREIVSELRQPYAEQQMPGDFAFALVPFYDYVRACTPGTARVLVVGFAPEVPFYARRGFAGGVVTLFGGYHSSPAEQDLVVERLRAELVPFVVIPPETAGELRERYSRIDAHVRENYRRLWDVPVDGYRDNGQVLVRTDIAAVKRYGPAQWPCFQ
jgi:hypothetical protein